MKKIDIPIKPMSINTAWQGRRYKTKKYKQYEQDVGLTVSRGTPYKGEVISLAVFFIHNYGNTDAGNLEKPLTDIIDKLDYLDDDRTIKWNNQIKVRAEDKQSQRTEVYIAPNTVKGHNDITSVIESFLF
jgi:Holliday junction resolvase RusA-like endonuclease